MTIRDPTELCDTIHDFYSINETFGSLPDASLLDSPSFGPRCLWIWISIFFVYLINRTWSTCTGIDNWINQNRLTLSVPVSVPHLPPVHTGHAGWPVSVVVASCRPPAKITNQRPVNLDQSSIRYPGHSRPRPMRASTLITWSLSTNERTVFWSHDHFRPMSGQYHGHMMNIDQWEATPVALMGLSGKSRDPTSGILHIVKDP